MMMMMSSFSFRNNWNMLVQKHDMTIRAGSNMLEHEYHKINILIHPYQVFEMWRKLMVRHSAKCQFPVPGV